MGGGGEGVQKKTYHFLVLEIIIFIHTVITMSKVVIILYIKLLYLKRYIANYIQDYDRDLHIESLYC